MGETLVWLLIEISKSRNGFHTVGVLVISNILYNSFFLSDHQLSRFIHPIECFPQTLVYKVSCNDSSISHFIIRLFLRLISVGLG